jgi:hypothetical protein
VIQTYRIIILFNPKRINSFFLENAEELHIIIFGREKGKSPNNPTNTKDTRTHAPLVEEVTFVPEKTHKVTKN